MNNNSLNLNTFLFYGLQVVGFAVVTGLVIDYILFELIGMERANTRLQMIFFALFYTMVFMTFGLAESKLLEKIATGLNTIKDLFLHIAIRSTGMIFAFLTASFTLDLVNFLSFGEFMIFDLSRPIFWVIAIVSFAAAIFGASLYYGITFYHRLQELEKSNLQSKYSALKAQVNPHFLFNSLNSITSLIRTDPEKAEAVTQDLADIFRYSLKSSKVDMILLQDELEAVRQYISIEQARFGERLSFSITLPENSEAIRIPAFSIQPLIENAVKHGVSQSAETCNIELIIADDEETLHIEVRDSGPGFPSTDISKLFQNGNGLQNIAERLSILFPRKSDITISKNSIRLAFPKTQTFG